MTRGQFEAFILALPGVQLAYPFGKHVAAYMYHMDGRDDKIVALVHENSKPLRVTLKCDPLLAQNIQEKYESVLPGQHMNKKHWITVICSGQLSDQEIFDLTRLSWQLTAKPESL